MCAFYVPFVVLQAQGCDRLVLEPNRASHVVSAGETVEVKCLCDEGGDERAEWYFTNGTRLPLARRTENRDRPYYKRHEDGETLVVPQVTESNGVGVYRCEGGSLAKNISVQILRSGTDGRG